MEDKVINFKKEKESKENNIFEQTLDSLKEAGIEFGDIQELSSLLVMPDEDFDLISPYILLELEKSLNNINDKLLLVQSFNAAGANVNDIQNVFEDFIKEIDKQMISLSANKKDFLKKMISILLNTISDTDGIAKKQVRIPIECINDNVRIPEYANLTDTGLDIFAIDDYTINPGETKIIPTGIKVAIPLGYELQVRPKSGKSIKTKMRVANSPGTIDSGYRDEIGVIIDNIEPPIADITYNFDEKTHYPIITSILHGKPMYITKGEKFAQLVLKENPKVIFYKVNDVNEIIGNRGGGFGSTDNKK